MAAIDERVVRELAEFRATAGAVASCYLDVDGRRFVRPHDYELHLERLLRDAREQAGNGDGAPGAAVEPDLRRIEDFVKSGLDRSRTRGLAIFSASADDLWRVIELPVPVRNQLVVDRAPYVRQLEAIVAGHERFAVLLADRQRARLFLFELGELVEKQEHFDQLPRHEDDHGEWDKDHVRDHAAAATHHHLRHASQVAFTVFQEQPFDHLVIGAPDELVGDVERELHSYLQERIAARVNVRVSASDDEIRQAALEVEQEVERRRLAAAVGRLRDAVGAGGGVAGLGDVLAGLVERRVDTLLVAEGYVSPGWRCRACNLLAVKGRSCPVCGRAMEQLDDVVEHAVAEAIAQSCRVEVCADDADLDVL